MLPELGRQAGEILSVKVTGLDNLISAMSLLENTQVYQKHNLRLVFLSPTLKLVKDQPDIVGIPVLMHYNPGRRDGERARLAAESQIVFAQVDSVSAAAAWQMFKT